MCPAKPELNSQVVEWTSFGCLGKVEDCLSGESGKGMLCDARIMCEQPFVDAKGKARQELFLQQECTILIDVYAAMH